MAYKNMNGLTKSEQEYFDLSEIYLSEYNDMLLPSKKIMVAQGIIVSMYSDILSFLSKNKPTERSKVQKERIELLLEIITDFSVVSSSNIQMKLDIKSRANDNYKLKKEIQALNKTIITLNNLINETSK